MLAMAGVSGVGALAGCTQSSPTQEGTSETTEGTSVASRTYRNGTQNNPADHNANLYNAQNFLEVAGRLLHDRFVAYSFATDEFQTVALESLNIDGTTVTLTLRDDLTWDNGQDVTTQDIETQLQLLDKTGGEIWGYLDDYEVVDEKTVELRLQEETNPRIIKYTLNNMRVDTPHSVFGEYVDKPPEEVQTFQWEDGIVASGPWSHVRKDQ